MKITTVELANFKRLPNRTESNRTELCRTESNRTELNASSPRRTVLELYQTF